MLGGKGAVAVGVAVVVCCCWLMLVVVVGCWLLNQTRHRQFLRFFREFRTSQLIARQLPMNPEIFSWNASESPDESPGGNA